MSIILVLAVALVAGIALRNRWALLIPLTMGAAVFASIAVSGGNVSDTPIPFLVLVSTLVMVGGQGLRPKTNQAR